MLILRLNRQGKDGAVKKQLPAHQVCWYRHVVSSFPLLYVGVRAVHMHRTKYYALRSQEINNGHPKIGIIN